MRYFITIHQSSLKRPLHLVYLVTCLVLGRVSSAVCIILGLGGGEATRRLRPLGRGGTLCGTRGGGGDGGRDQSSTGDEGEEWSAFIFFRRLYLRGPD